MVLKRGEISRKTAQGGKLNGKIKKVLVFFIRGERVLGEAPPLQPEPSLPLAREADGIRYSLHSTVSGIEAMNMNSSMFISCDL